MLSLASTLGMLSLTIFFLLLFAWISAAVHSHHGKLKQLVDTHLISNSDPFDLRLAMVGLWLLAIVPAVAVYVATNKLWLSLFTIVLCLGIQGLAIRHLRRRRFAQVRRQLPDLLTIMAGSLRAGTSLQQTLIKGAGSVEAPLRMELEHVQRDLRLGLNFSQALSGLERRMPIEEVSLLILILRVSHESGGSSADALQSLGDVLRRKLALEAKIRALTAQGRLQATIMSLLPLILLMLLCWIDPMSAQELLTTRNGQLALALTGVLQLVGVALIRRIIAIEV
jgi:tight adherence protein B